MARMKIDSHEISHIRSGKQDKNKTCKCCGSKREMAGNEEICVVCWGTLNEILEEEK